MALDTSNVFFSDHALIKMKAKKITQSMVFDVLRKGSVHMEPEPDIKTGDTKCRMERFTAGKPIAVVVACEDENALDCLVVTSFIIGD